MVRVRYLNSSKSEILTFLGVKTLYEFRTVNA